MTIDLIYGPGWHNGRSVPLALVSPVRAAAGMGIVMHARAKACLHVRHLAGTLPGDMTGSYRR